MREMRDLRKILEKACHDAWMKPAGKSRKWRKKRGGEGGGKGETRDSRVTNQWSRRQRGVTRYPP